jgi:hypothetical protein
MTTEVGFGFGRSGDQVIALVSYSQSRDEIQPFSLLPDERGNIVLEGRVASEVEYFTGYINQGRFGVASCQVDLGVPKPRFRVFCHMAPNDRSAWEQIAYNRPRNNCELAGDRPALAAGENSMVAAPAGRHRQSRR